MVIDFSTVWLEAISHVTKELVHLFGLLLGRSIIHVLLVGRSGFFFSRDRDVTDKWVQVADAGKLRRKKGMFGRQSVDKEVIFNQAFFP